LIELWETFLLQLDAEEEGNPLFHPRPAATTATSSEAAPSDSASQATHETATTVVSEQAS